MFVDQRWVNEMSIALMSIVALILSVAVLSAATADHGASHAHYAIHR